MAVFRVEKTKNYAVMSKHHFQDKSISLKAKGLLSEMLSLPESWDYTLAGLASINKESVDAIRTAVWELEKAGYIVRRQGRDEKGKMSAIEYIIYEHPQLPTPTSENPILENPTSDNPITANPSAAYPTAENPTQLNNKQSNTKELSIDSINHPSIKDGADEMKTRSELEEEIKTNIDYDIIVENKQNDKRQIDEIVTLMLDAICSPSPTVRINGTDIPKSAVRERFLQLDSEHIEYVIFAMERSKPEIRNIRAYLLTALYNAPATMDSYYAALVSHDLNLYNHKLWHN